MKAATRYPHARSNFLRAVEAQEYNAQMSCGGETKRFMNSGLIAFVGFYPRTHDVSWIALASASIVILLLGFIAWRLMRKMDD